MLKLLMKLLLLVAVLAGAVQSQSFLPDDDGFASNFIVKLHALRPTNTFLSIGVLINPRSIVTVASAIYGMNTTEFNVHFGGTRLTGRQSAMPELFHIHPDFDPARPLENNLAVVRLAAADGNRTGSINNHRRLGSTQLNQFCTMLGYGTTFSDENQGNEPMSITPALLQDTSACGHLFPGDYLCTIGRANTFPQCGGFLGAPILCDGERLGGMVVQEHYCGVNPRAYVINVANYEGWIADRSGASSVSATATIIIALSCLISKLLVL
jgi:Trypsin